MGVLNSILWVLILIWIAWPVAFFCSFIYIFCSPFLVCIPGCQGVVDLLKKGVEWPHKCGEKIVAGADVC